MDTFEYLAVLVSIIVGLGVAHVLQAVGRVIGRPGEQRLYWVHSMWVLSMLVYLVYFWWFELGFRATEEWSAPLYVFVVGYAIALYLMSVVIVPVEPEPDYRAYFFARRRWIYGFVFITFLFDLADTFLKPEFSGTELPVGNIVLTTVVMAGVCVAGGVSKKAWVHGLFVTLWLLINVAGLLSSPERGLG